MSHVAGRPWDIFKAELADTQRYGQHENAQLRPCVYCSAPTRSLYRVCLAHTDLLDLDPQAPAALEETRAAQPPDVDGLPQSLASPSALVSSSATLLPDGENGDVPGSPVALEILGTA